MYSLKQRIDMFTKFTMPTIDGSPFPDTSYDFSTTRFLPAVPRLGRHEWHYSDIPDTATAATLKTVWDRGTVTVFTFPAGRYCRQTFISYFVVNKFVNGEYVQYGYIAQLVIVKDYEMLENSYISPGSITLQETQNKHHIATIYRAMGFQKNYKRFAAKQDDMTLLYHLIN